MHSVRWLMFVMGVKRDRIFKYQLSHFSAHQKEALLEWFLDERAR
jgi:hypothetical protein